MRAVGGMIVCLALLVGLAVVAAEFTEKIVYESKLGNVTFDHKKHSERVKDDCKACHDKLFPQARGPLNYKEKMHRVAEEKRISCAGCHHPGGTAFESKGNCTKCHVKAPAKPAAPKA